jgi:hypothetical protein
MNRFAALAFFLLPLAVVPADPLWTRAVEIHRDHADLVPGSMAIRFDQYNGRGELVSTDETVLAIEVGEDGALESRVTNATSNGEDVTEDRRRSGRFGSSFGGPPSAVAQDDGGDGNAFAGLQLSPFDPAEQENVTVTRLSGTRTADGIPARAFAFEHRTGERSVNRGTAWLDPSTGEPIRLRLTIEPLPRFVSELVMTQHYARDPGGRWAVERMEITGEGRVLFFRRRVQGVFLFSDYFRAP